MLVGFDLKKDPDLLHRACSDGQGVTSEFNYNLLDRMNSELGADFDRDRFVHHASYNVVQGCVVSWLISTQRQEVRFRSLGRTFSLDAWEGIHLECSYKYPGRHRGPG